MKVVQTNGQLEEFNPNKILYKIKALSEGLNVDTDNISQLIISRIIDGITTEEINKLSANLANTKISTSYDYSILAARLTIDNLYKKVAKSFVASTNKLNNYDMLSPIYYNKVMLWGDFLEEHIVHERDFNFDYLGVNNLLKSYLKKYDEEILETPQCMYMRLAVFLSDTKEDAIKLYHQFSQHEISPASPIIFNAGTKESTLISCNLVTGLDSVGYNGEHKDPDSLEGLHELYKQASKLSAGAAGLGIDATDIRSKEAIINSSGGKAGGILKMVLKPLNELMRGYNQKGSRPGAAAIYIEPWHMDIEDLLRMKRPSTSVEQACRDLFSAIWMPDLFMQRLEERINTGTGKWTLFDPKSLKDNSYDLHGVYGSEFKRQYELAEKDDKVLKKEVDVKEIWDLITSSQMESGVPYITYKDRANESNMQSNIGVLKQSNLCVAPESLLLTNKGYIPIEELKDQEVTIWNGFEWSDTIVRQTGSNQELLKVTLNDGNEIYATEYHRWSIKNGYDKSDLEVKRTTELVPGDKLTRCEFPLIKEGDNIWSEKTAYTHGFFCSDGFYRNGNPHIYLYDEKKDLLPYIETRNKFTGGVYNDELDELAINEYRNRITVGLDFNIQPKYYVPINHFYKERLKWFEGVVDGDGTIVRNGSSFGLQLASIHFDYLVQISLMLNTLGISSTISISRKECMTMMPDGKGGEKEYATQTCYRLLISHYYLTKLKNLGFSPNRLCLKGMSICTSNRTRLTTVISVEREGRYDDTYCLTENKRGTMVINGNMIFQCNEILEVTDSQTVANCVLSAVPIGKPIYIKNGTVNWEKLRDSTHSIVKYLNKICDINAYPTPQAKKGGMDQRALGIGLMGLADLFAQLDLAYDSGEALKLSNKVSEHMYYYALEASNNLAKKGLLYGKYQGSPYEEGLLHFDKYLENVQLDSSLDWYGLKESIRQYGVANSLLICQFPTASSANLLSLNEACEPFVDLIYKRTLSSGEFVVVNRHLVKELEDLGFWSDALKNEIIIEESVQNILLERYSSSKTSQIAEEKGFDYITGRVKKIKEKYKTAWELGAKPIINQASGRQPFVDQTQSMNIWMSDPTSSKLTSMFLYGWKQRLKTGSYYIRSSKKSNNKQLAGVQSYSKPTNSEVDCIGCTV